MATTLATRQDLQVLAQQIDSRFALMAQEIASLRSSIARDLEVLRSDMTRDMESLRLSLIVRLGAMMFMAMGLLFTALKLT